MTELPDEVQRVIADRASAYLAITHASAKAALDWVYANAVPEIERAAFVSASQLKPGSAEALARRAHEEFNTLVGISVRKIGLIASASVGADGDEVPNNPSSD